MCCMLCAVCCVLVFVLGFGVCVCVGFGVCVIICVCVCVYVYVHVGISIVGVVASVCADRPVHDAPPFATVAPKCVEESHTH